MKIVRFALLLICAAALAGLAQQHFAHVRPPQRLPERNAALDKAFELAHISAESVLLLVLDQRCASCRTRHKEIRRMVEAADSAGHSVYVIALGPPPLDSAYYQLIAKPSEIISDPLGKITRSLKVSVVPAALITRGRRTVFASAPTSLEWPDWNLFTKALRL